MAESDIAELYRVARRLNRLAGAPPVPALWLLSDPVRAPDVLALVRRAPRGAAVVYRPGGQPDGALTRTARRLARQRGVTFLISADARTAFRLGAAGAHRPKARWSLRDRTGTLTTSSAHGPGDLQLAARRGVQAALLSKAFASASAGAGRVLGPVRLSALVRGGRIPVIALGGVTARTARRLVGTGVAGLAAVRNV